VWPLQVPLLLQQKQALLALLALLGRELPAPVWAQGRRAKLLERLLQQVLQQMRQHVLLAVQ
jgi:hypothetical protein